LSVDADNNLYFVTGNGSFNAFNNSRGTEYGDTVLKLSTGGGLSVADYFTPYNQSYLAQNNLDLGSSGVLLLPDQAGPFPHLLVAGGKANQFYVINRDLFTAGNNHFNTNGATDAVLQTLSLNGGVMHTPAYFNGMIYFIASKDVLQAFSVSNGALSSSPVSVGPRKFAYPGATPSVSANGATDGIVWAVMRANPAVLTAYDATDVSKEIYNSTMSGTRDQLANGVKFAVPTIANGKVYVGGQYAVSVFGLLGSGPGNGSPPPAGTYNGLFFERDGAEFMASGSFTATATKRGTFTGRLQMGASAAPFRGQFDSSGSATSTIQRRGLNPLTLTMQSDPNDNNRLMGTVSDGTWVAQLVANRSPFKARTSPAPFAGKYTLVLPGPGDGDSQTPQGDGFGTLTVTPSGQVQFAAALADGTRLTQSTTVSQAGEWPIYVPLYRGQGQVLGWVTFASTAQDDLNGPLSWIKLPNARTAYYPQGFTLQPVASGSAYQPPAPHTPILNVTDGLVTLTDGNLDSSITDLITLNENNKVFSSNPVSLTFSPANGRFKGAVPNPLGHRPITFNGVVLQKQNFGSGYFLGPTQSGRVYVGPQ
jgi:hypothetical protein